MPAVQLTGRPSRVAVGMPVYNGERWLRESVSSILAQTMDDLLLIISDNASTDRTQEICRDFAAQDRRVLYYRNTRNIGVFGNYDRVFELSDSEYFKWASCNDYCDPELLEACLEPLERRSDVVLAYPRTRLFETDLDGARDFEDGLNLEQDCAAERFCELLRRISLNNVMNGVIRASALRLTGLNRPYLSSDFNMLAELALQGKFVEVRRPLFYRRMNLDNTTAAQAKASEGFFGSQGRKVRRMPSWLVEYHYFLAAIGAKVGWRGRFQMLRLLTRRWFWSRQALFHELAGSHRR